MDKGGKVHITNEEIRKRFSSNFELVNYAISIAENMIKSGRESRVKSDTQNRAMQVLEEIYAGKDKLDPIKSSPGGFAIEGTGDEIEKQPLVFEDFPSHNKSHFSESFDDE